MVDPLPGNGIASFMNDARDSKRNNSKLQLWCDSATGQISLFVMALRPLYPGEEVFISYGNGCVERRYSLSAAL